MATNFASSSVLSTASRVHRAVKLETAAAARKASSRWLSGQASRIAACRPCARLRSTNSTASAANATDWAGAKGASAGTRSAALV